MNHNVLPKLQNRSSVNALLVASGHHPRALLHLLRGLLLIPLMTGLITGCEDSKPDLEGFVNKVKSRPVKPPKSLPEPYIYEPVPYLRTDSRSPFRPVELVAAEAAAQEKQSTIQPDFSREKDELEAYALSELTLVGILEREGEQSALVSTPDGQVVIVQKGAYMGRNYGLIKSVSDNQILLREIVKDAEGLWEERETGFGFQQGE